MLILCERSAQANRLHAAPTPRAQRSLGAPSFRARSRCGGDLLALRLLSAIQPLSGLARESAFRRHPADSGNLPLLGVFGRSSRCCQVKHPGEKLALPRSATSLELNLFGLASRLIKYLT
jgi:hypothetical protein